MGGKLLAWFGGAICFFLVLGIAMTPLEEGADVPRDSGAVAVSAPTPEVLSVSKEEPESISQVSAPTSAPTPPPTQMVVLEPMATSAPGEPPTAEPVPEPSASATVEQIDYVLNINSRKFHIPSCASVGLMNESNKRFFAGTRDDVIEQGFEPCQNCDP